MKRAELFASDATRRCLRFHDLRASGIAWRAVRGDDPLKIIKAAGRKDFATTLAYVRDAEQVRADFGEVFPALPAALLGAGESLPESLPDRKRAPKTAQSKAKNHRLGGNVTR